MPLQQGLEMLLADVCLFLGIHCVIAIRPAQLARGKGLYPVKRISKTNTH